MSSGENHKTDSIKAAAVFRTLMKMGKPEERLKFRCSVSLRRRCQQV